ncbi:ABC transporter substrate-binding protein [Lacibacterium aquatile]|uniref:ABC transporter substrate-binding protein n=1 Tax=Lacibacterium aquatile TaxID=1168082 RepID=A0ABW5DVJ7_9PROT
MRWTSALLATAALTMVPLVAPSAKTFKWINDGDVVSMDPTYFNETFLLGFMQNIYEPLARRSKTLELEPALATKWEQVDPKTWRFTLRQGVKYHGGESFTADDVVFSLERARMDGSDVKSKLASIDTIKKVDDFTVDLITKVPDPLLPGQLGTVFILSKQWAEKNNAMKPTDVKKKEEGFITRNANGTGPFQLVTREPGVRTTLKANAAWWDKPEHNLTEVIFEPVPQASTRLQALLAGQADMVYTLSTQDIDRVKKEASLKMYEGPEMRTIFLGFDQKRDELEGSNIKGKNPFKDVRVRKAVYQAIDENAIVSRVMRNAATATGLMVAPTINGFDKEQNARFPFDPEASKKLLAEAGYPDGFEVLMDCPNDRYANDEQTCLAIVPMLKRIGITAKLTAQSKATYFPKILGRNSSFYLLGWTPDTYDSYNALFNLMATPGDGGRGAFNLGSWSNAKFDELTAKVQSETDQAKRNAMIKEAFQIHKDEVGHIPLHQTSLAWAAKKNIDLVQGPDNIFQWRWVKVN